MQKRCNALLYYVSGVRGCCLFGIFAQVVMSTNEVEMCFGKPPKKPETFLFSFCKFH